MKKSAKIVDINIFVKFMRALHSLSSCRLKMTTLYCRLRMEENPAGKCRGIGRCPGDCGSHYHKAR
jgi:hypothetical protein